MKLRRTLTLALFVGFVVSPALPQTVGATMTGVVKDGTGATIPGARVVVTNVGTNAERNVTSNASGLYSISDVPAGVYRVSISAQGFSTGVTNGVQLTVGGSREVDGTLSVGAVNNTVEVNTSPADVEIDSSIVSATVGEKRIVELPLNGRDWTQLATLQPGVNFVRSQPPTGSAGASNRGSRGYGTQLTVNGHSPYENSYRLDGVNENDYSNGAPGSPLGVNLGVDAIQEFSVITSAYTAEYGRTSGGIVNAITRSGTNKVHGSAYIFDRDSIFDARNYFDPAAIPTLHREQFGGSLGGPIRKDKTFAFATYEGIRQSAGLANHQHDADGDGSHRCDPHGHGRGAAGDGEPGDCAVPEFISAAELRDRGAGNVWRCGLFPVHGEHDDFGKFCDCARGPDVVGQGHAERDVCARQQPGTDSRRGRQ